MTDAMDWPLGEIADVLQVPPPASGRDVVIRRFETDSRDARPGDLFPALPGAVTDGHRFLPDAARAGVSAILCARGRGGEAGPSAPPILEVDDTLAAYRLLAGAWRRRFPGPVAAVAGSVGKTTTTAMVAALLSGAHGDRVLRTPPQRNGWVGLPKSLLALRPGCHEVAVFEVGTDAPGMTLRQVEMVAPDATLVTAIAEEHLDALGDLEGVEREQLDAFVATALAGGTLVVDGDEPRLWRALEGGFPDADRLAFTLEGDPRVATTGLVGKRTGPGRLAVHGGPLAGGLALSIPAAGPHHAHNALAAVATAVARGVTDPDALRRGWSALRLPGGRCEVRSLPGGATLVADHYNASPRSMRAALATAGALRDAVGAGGRLVLALGDMLELGDDEEGHHRDLGPPIREVRPDAVHLFGERMRWLADPLARAGVPVTHHGTMETLTAALTGETATEGAVILLKGSRGTRMERALPTLDLGF